VSPSDDLSGEGGANGGQQHGSAGGRTGGGGRGSARSELERRRLQEGKLRERRHVRRESDKFFFVFFGIGRGAESGEAKKNREKPFSVKSASGDLSHQMLDWTTNVQK
jgi:hypothetical protein